MELSIQTRMLSVIQILTFPSSLFIHFPSHWLPISPLFLFHSPALRPLFHSNPYPWKFSHTSNLGDELSNR